LNDIGNFLRRKYCTINITPRLMNLKRLVKDFLEKIKNRIEIIIN